MSTLLIDKIKLDFDFKELGLKLNSTKEVTNIANIIIYAAKQKNDMLWSKNALKRLKDYANACNIQDYPQYMGNFKNDKIYLGRYFLEAEIQQGLKFCELYWTKCFDTVMLLAKYSHRDNDMDGVTVENIESSVINKMTIPEELKAAYIRYLLAV